MESGRTAVKFVQRLTDGEADEREVDFARKVLAPSVAAVAATAIGFGIAQACCGVKVRKADPRGVLPIAMAAVTSLIAIWSYANPQPSKK